MTNDILSAGPFPFLSSLSLSLSVSCGCKRDGGMPQICHICLLTAGHSDEHFKLPQERGGWGDAKAGGKLASHCFSGGSSGGDFSKLSTADNAQRDAVHVANCQPKTMPIAGGEWEEGVPENSNILNILMHALHTKFSLFYLLEQPAKQFELQFAN